MTDRLLGKSSLALPLELIEDVTDQAQDDAGSLRNLALTCRDLLPRSRYHLFTSIRIEGTPQLHTFYEFLDAYPHLCPLVHSVTMSTILNRPETKSLVEIVPIPILTKLPSLFQWKIIDSFRFKPPSEVECSARTDRYRSRSWLSFHSSTLTCLWNFAGSITTLHLYTVAIKDTAQLARYLLAFTGLRHLHCRRLALQEEAHSTSPAMHHLKLRLSKKLRLTTLVIDCGVPFIVAELLLQSSRSTLRELELHLEKENSTAAPQWPDLIVQCAKLVSLSLALHIIDFRVLKFKPFESDGRTQEEVLKLAYNILTSLRLPALTYLGIKLPDFNYSLFDHYLKNKALLSECTRLEQVLLAGLPRLRKVEICEIYRPRRMIWSPILEHHFPLLYQRGLFAFKTLSSNNELPIAHCRSVTSLAFSPDGQLFATGSADCTIILWDALRHSTVHDWRPGLGVTYSLAFSPDSRHLASGGVQGRVIVWDVSQGVPTLVASPAHHARGKEVACCVWSPDGAMLVSASSSTVMIWDTTNFHQLRRLDTPPAISWRDDFQLFLFSPDGRWVASASAFRKHGCDVRDGASGVLHKVLWGHTRWINAAAFDPGSRRIATASDDCIVCVWDVERGVELVAFEGHAQAVRDVTFSPDGTSVLSASEDGSVMLWDSLTGDVLLVFQGHSDVVCTARFSPDGRYIASASEDATVRLWRRSDGLCVRTLTEHTDGVTHLAFSPDGKTLASGGRDGRVCIREFCYLVPRDGVTMWSTSSVDSVLEAV